MSDPSAPIALSAHLALVSSISFGGFPTVLPDIHNFVVVTHGWMTDQEFANFFAIAQSIPGPNMILMMSFIGGRRGDFPEPSQARLPPLNPLVPFTSSPTGYGIGSAMHHGSGSCVSAWFR